MAFIPLFRKIIFTLVTLLSLVVLGICAHIEYLVVGYTGTYLTFAPLGLAVSCLTIVSLPLFLILGSRRPPVFTSIVLFEIIWFFGLWLVWVYTAGDTAVDRAYDFPGGCIYDQFPETNRICYEFTLVEAIAFVNFFCAFLYYDVIFIYAIISAIRGRSIWVASVEEAAGVVPSAVSPAPIIQPQFVPTPTTQYGVYPSSVSPPQPYSLYPRQVPAPTVPPYNVYAQQVPAQGPIPQHYNAYPPQGVPMTPADPSQQYDSPTPVGGYAGHVLSPSPNGASLPPQQPNYSAHPVHGSQGQVPAANWHQQVALQASAPRPSPYDDYPAQAV